MQNQGDFTFTQEQFFALMEQNKTLLEANKKQQELIASLELKVLQLTQKCEKLSQMVFGSKHERFEGNNNPLQLSLTLGLDEIKPSETKPQTEEIAYTRTKKEDAKKPVRTALPSDLPRVIIVIQPEEDTTGMKLIGHEITEQLEMTPAKFFVKQYKRAKYVRPEGNGIAIGKLPELALPKAIAGSTVAAHILISKYIDHLPLFRQQAQYMRIGLKLNDATMGGWVKDSISLLSILHERIVQLLLTSGYIQLDETTIPVLSSEKKGKTHRGYFWVSHSPQKKLAVFYYDPGRSSSFPNEFLKEYQGFLQTDGYGVYDHFGKVEGITPLACLAHARRKFIEALGEKKDMASYFIEKIQILYQLERELRDTNASDEIILKHRKETALPVLKELHQWLKDNLAKERPTSLIGKAISYALNRWDKMMVYTTDARLQIDNNLVENQIRPVALGRKNYMFCGSHDSAKRTAIMYTLFACCKLNNVNPHDWLNDVLVKLPSRQANDIDDLLPHNWVAQK